MSVEVLIQRLDPGAAAAVVRPSGRRRRGPPRRRGRRAAAGRAGGRAAPASRSRCPTATPRSCIRGPGLAARLGVTLVNAPGTIDAGYRGEIKVTLINTDTKEPVRLRRGDRIAQLVIQRVERARFHEVERLPGSARGEAASARRAGSPARRRPDAEVAGCRHEDSRWESESSVPTSPPSRAGARQRRSSRRRRQPRREPAPGTPTSPTPSGSGSTSAACGCPSGPGFEVQLQRRRGPDRRRGRSWWTAARCRCTRSPRRRAAASGTRCAPSSSASSPPRAAPPRRSRARSASSSPPRSSRATTCSRCGSAASTARAGSCARCSAAGPRSTRRPPRRWRTWSATSWSCAATGRCRPRSRSSCGCPPEARQAIEQQQAAAQDGRPDLDPFERGPEITETR